MHDPDSGAKKDNTVRFRASETTSEYIKHLKEMWGCSSESEALRILVHMTVGILHGDISGILDEERLRDQWGETGVLLAAALNEDSPVPDGLKDARLGDVLEDVPILLGAAQTEAHIRPPRESD